ncbi:hypothetical protein E1B28_003178 [Marasmius oreades]|uniref:FAD dependent oxidoreductase domain-containing protein n=1 Tax=Marasmius oreades TaxID=181124 RepID=A0A9P7RKJ4_9AGAR|nr:uncharacterized protein E1B28_003178 [Marasmius oreades]KAG7085631.1 hypothetical protein E1B28_003178 [Marasmius oreades]
MSRTAHSDLNFWRDLTPLHEPLNKPTNYSKHILVVGGGVIGLTTSWALLDRGYHVTIMSKEWASFGKEQRLASQIAGALWEYPPAVCGQHTDKISLQHSKKWCMVAYHIWNAIASNEELSKAAGVRMMPSAFYFPNPIDSDDFQREKMEETSTSGVVGFDRGGKELITKRGIDPAHGGVDAYEIMAPIIDTDAAMAWLMTLVKAKGAKMHTETIQGDLLKQEQQLRERFQVDAIVNCTGIAGAEVAADNTCYPIRGGLFRVINDGNDFPKVEAAMTISADVARHNEIVFIVPRNDNILLMGGFTEPHNWRLDLTLDSPVMQRMKARCEAFLPALKNARLDPEYPIAQGLRPFRGTNIRVERELRPLGSGTAPSRIVHSYGHGGAGWTLSFGCAGDVLRLVEEALMDLKPKGTTSATAAGPAVQARM